MSEKRDTVNYTLRNGRFIVYHGITNDIDRRVAEHEADGKKFTSVTYSAPRTRASACRHEAEDIKRYQENHGGDFPKYNKKV